MIGRQFVARLLIVVSRTNPAQQTYLKHVFGSQTEDVILDRRVGERRQHPAPVAVERRRIGARQRRVSQGRQVSGQALVRRYARLPFTAPCPPRGSPRGSGTPLAH